MAAALASSPLVHLTDSRLRLPRPRAQAPAPGCSRVVSAGWRPTVGWRTARRCDRPRCLSNDGGGGEDGEKRGEEEATAAAASAEAQVGTAEELGSERSRSGSFSSSSTSSGVYIGYKPTRSISTYPVRTKKVPNVNSSKRHGVAGTVSGQFLARVFWSARPRLESVHVSALGSAERQARGSATSASGSTVGEDVTDEGVVRLAATRDWASGESDLPVTKRVSAKERQNESDKRKELNLLKYQALKDELLLVTTGIGAACSLYCLLVFSFEAAVSYAFGVACSCLYLQLLYRHTDNLSKGDIPEIFLKKKVKKKIGITSEDLKSTIEKALGGTSVALSSPRLVIPAMIFGLSAFSDHFQNSIFSFELVPGMMGFLAYKAAALVQVYRDNEDLRLILPEEEDTDRS